MGGPLKEIQQSYIGLDYSYSPCTRVAKILNWSLQKVNTVPYPVSLRWGFYRCLQELGLQKRDYEKYKKWTVRARKCFWNGWRPYTFTDETRKILDSGLGWVKEEDWLKSFIDKVCFLDKRLGQDRVVLLLYEANAMTGQFEHYSKPWYVPLVPFGGDASVDYKWRIAKKIERLYETHKKPIEICYFGDYDKKGLQIPVSAIADIRNWCRVDFKFTRVGLEPEHIRRWQIPENPERPGEFQWEALPDEAARELIVGTLNKYLDLDKTNEVKQREDTATRKWQKVLKSVLGEIKKEEERSALS